MSTFLITLITVGCMLLFAIPGFLFIKFHAIKEEQIGGFSKVLMMAAQPALTVYSFQLVTRSKENTIAIGLVLLMSFLLMLSVMMFMTLILRKHFGNVKNRVMVVCSAFGNVAFLGVPILQNVLPDYAGGPMCCATFVTAMTILGWSLASSIITKDRKYIHIRKILLNPATLSFALSLILYFCDWHIQDIPYVGETFFGMLMILGKMSTILCMLILGMRLATIPLRPLFTDYHHYIAIAIKQIILPLLVFGILYAIPMDDNLKMSFVLLSACPVAAVVQNFTEMLGEGQESAADTVILGTVLSVLTLPLITLLF